MTVSASGGVSYTGDGGGGGGFTAGQTPNRFPASGFAANRGAAITLLNIQTALGGEWLADYNTIPTGQIIGHGVEIAFVAATIDTVEVLTRSDGEWVILSSATGIPGPAGINTTGAEINQTTGNLILTMSEGDPIDAGNAKGQEGPPGDGEDSSFKSPTAMFDYWAGGKYSQLEDGDNVSVTDGEVVFWYRWEGGDGPSTYDSSFWVRSDIGSNAGGVVFGPTSLESSATMLLFKSISGNNNFLLQSTWDDTGTTGTFTPRIGAASDVPIGTAFDQTLTGLIKSTVSVPALSVTTSFQMLPATEGTYTYQSWAGADDTGEPVISERVVITAQNVTDALEYQSTSGVSGATTVVSIKNPAIFKLGESIYTEAEGIDVLGGTDAGGQFPTEELPFTTLSLQVVTLEELAIVTDTVSNLTLGTAGPITLTIDNANGSGIILPAAGGGDSGVMTSAQELKLAAVADGATADQTMTSAPAPTGVDLALSGGDTTTVDLVTTSLAGVMDPVDKVKLDTIATAATIDQTLEIIENAADVDVNLSGGDLNKIDAATPSLAGVMTAADKTKLDSLGDEADQVKTNANDTAPGFLIDKITGVGLTITESGTTPGDNTLIITNDGATGGTTVSVTTDDTAPGFLFDKLTTGAGLTLAVQNPGVDEDLLLTIDAIAETDYVFNGRITTTSSTSSAITPMTEELDPEGMFDDATDTLTIPITGYWLIGFTIEGGLDAANDGVTLVWGNATDSVTANASQVSADASNTMVSGVTIVSLTAADELTLDFTSVGTGSIIQGSTSSIFAHYIGATLGGSGGVTNLDTNETETVVNITNTNGTNAQIPAAGALAGVMTKAMVDKLAGIEDNATAEQDLDIVEVPTRVEIQLSGDSLEWIDLADAVNAGVMSPADFTKLAALATPDITFTPAAGDVGLVIDGGGTGTLAGAATGAAGVMSGDDFDKVASITVDSVKTTAADTAAEYLDDKIKGVGTVTVTTVDTAGVISLEIEASGGGGGGIEGVTLDGLVGYTVASYDNGDTASYPQSDVNTGDNTAGVPYYYADDIDPSSTQQFGVKGTNSLIDEATMEFIPDTTGDLTAITFTVVSSETPSGQGYTIQLFEGATELTGILAFQADDYKPTIVFDPVIPVVAGTTYRIEMNCGLKTYIDIYAPNAGAWPVMLTHTGVPGVVKHYLARDTQVSPIFVGQVVDPTAQTAVNATLLTVYSGTLDAGVYRVEFGCTCRVQNGNGTRWTKMRFSSGATLKGEAYAGLAVVGSTPSYWGNLSGVVYVDHPGGAWTCAANSSNANNNTIRSQYCYIYAAPGVVVPT